MLQKNAYDLYFISGTWLGKNISDNSILENTPYSIIRVDRNLKRGGEVMAIISNSIPFTKIYVSKNGVFDILCFDIISPSVYKKHRFILVYFPPSLKYEGQLWLAKTLFDLTTIPSFSIMGDFNLPSIPWDSLDFSANNDKHNPFFDYIVEANLKQVVTFPTRQENFLDLIFSSAPKSFEKIEKMEPFQYKESISDHYGINFRFRFAKENRQSIAFKDFTNCNMSKLIKFYFRLIGT